MPNAGAEADRPAQRDGVAAGRKEDRFEARHVREIEGAGRDRAGRREKHAIKAGAAHDRVGRGQVGRCKQVIVRKAAAAKRLVAAAAIEDQRLCGAGAAVHRVVARAVRDVEMAQARTLHQPVGQRDIVGAVREVELLDVRHAGELRGRHGAGRRHRHEVDKGRRCAKDDVSVLQIGGGEEVDVVLSGNAQERVLTWRQCESCHDTLPPRTHCARLDLWLFSREAFGRPLRRPLRLC
jgi:hypothetical protein